MKVFAERECAYCGEEFVPKKVNQKYCDSECRDIAQNEGNKERNRTNHLRANSYCHMCEKPHYRKDAGPFTRCYICEKKMHKQNLSGLGYQEAAVWA